MFDEQKGGLGVQDQPLDLHTGKDVNIIERLVPDIEMGLLAQAPGKQNFFLLTVAEVGNIFVKLRAGKIQLAQDGFEKTLVDLQILRVGAQIAGKAFGALGNVGDFQPVAFVKLARMIGLEPAQDRSAGRFCKACPYDRS